MQEIFYTPIVVIHVVACAFLVLVVLLQPGKSGGLGALSGAGAQQVFGGRGAGNILTRITWITAATFFITSVTLAFLSSSGDDSMREREVEIGVIDEAPIKVPTAQDKEAKDKATEQQPSNEDEPNKANSSEPSSEDSENDAEESSTREGPEPEAPTTGGPSTPTPAAPVPPAPAVPKPAVPAAPKPAAPVVPATPQPVAPTPAPPQPAPPAPAAPAPTPGDAPY